ncbi:uncharacterized protein C8Q71DRAFT_728531 [Rhodofomes roseus]|uniref:Uncharacterized protein n=1 Tax=Rhodofomes roseus TaxID=34475 RepID=A0ABQ8JX61_9APHY|nr:uncharacterized protein C8Q71DRAFT_728531 [Rhodofomes roseus]KAH9828653.1 hypothetical protein C8Q71DRAFT_728531 [Rhodofomes roseus]
MTSVPAVNPVKKEKHKKDKKAAEAEVELKDAVEEISIYIVFVHPHVMVGVAKWNMLEGVALQLLGCCDNTDITIICSGHMLLVSGEDIKWHPKYSVLWDYCLWDGSLYGRCKCPPGFTMSEAELRPYAKSVKAPTEQPAQTQSSSAKSADSAPTMMPAKKAKQSKGKKTEEVKVEPESAVEEQGTGEATTSLKDEVLTLSKGIYVMFVCPNVIVGEAKWNALEGFALQLLGCHDNTDVITIHLGCTLLVSGDDVKWHPRYSKKLYTIAAPFNDYIVFSLWLCGTGFDTEWLEKDKKSFVMEDKTVDFKQVKVCIFCLELDPSVRFSVK